MPLIAARYVPLTRFVWAVRHTPGLFSNYKLFVQNVGSTLRAHRQMLTDEAGVVDRRCGPTSERPTI